MFFHIPGKLLYRPVVSCQVEKSKHSRPPFCDTGGVSHLDTAGVGGCMIISAWSHNVSIFELSHTRHLVGPFAGPPASFPPNMLLSSCLLFRVKRWKITQPAAEGQQDGEGERDEHVEHAGPAEQGAAAREQRVPGGQEPHVVGDGRGGVEGHEAG